jgi:D-beta-D-heptose 7-phosphate kinase/D-beta-D-heptose 1-phosphate adenosyltransferase
MHSCSIQHILKLANHKVLLVGDFMLDRYVYGVATRISPEAAVPVLRVTSREDRPGGAGAVAVNLLQLGASATCVGVVGRDAEGDNLTRQLAAAHADVGSLIPTEDRHTTVKQRIMGVTASAHPQAMVRLDEETLAPLASSTENLLIRKFEEELASADVVCLQDYHKGVLSARMCHCLINAARRAHKDVLVDPGLSADWQKYHGATLIKPNRREASQAAGFPVVTPTDAQKAALAIQTTLDVQTVVITLDRDGVYWQQRGQVGRRYRPAVRGCCDVTGAGDVFLAVLALACAAGHPMHRAVYLANTIAGLKVETFGTSAPGKPEIIERVRRMQGHTAAKILNRKILGILLREWRERRKKIVFTNGCFDLLHRGHIRLLEFCSAQGDIVIVGLNSDASVRANKGDERPINRLKDRAELLAALAAVHYVIPFNEPTPIKLIEAIRPDVLVKGQDWGQRGVVGGDFVASYGGKVRLAPFVKGRSSTSVVERIRALTHRRDRQEPVLP